MEYRTLWSNKIWRTTIGAVWVVVTLFFCFCILELSCYDYPNMNVIQHITNISIKNVAINLLTLAALLAIIEIFSGKIWLTCLIMSVLCGVLGAVNYYVIQFHTIPLSFVIIKNFATAMDVVSSYRITLKAVTCVIGLFTIIMAILCLLLWKLFGNQRISVGRLLIRKGLLGVFAVVVMYGCYFCSQPLVPENIIGWSWEEAYNQYGFITCTIESYRKSRNIVMKPELYSEEYVQTIQIDSGKKENPQTPDVILILNESFSDLQQITDLQTDVSYMEQIDRMENLLYGYVVAPGKGGSTNNSEYELLTSNSMWLIGGTPFNYMNLYGADSIVSHLNELGYSTLGAHSEAGLNYSRIQGYQALGFERQCFEDQFEDVEFLPGRWFETDDSLYRNLIRWYEESSESPRFLYLLTIQNHGGWDQSGPENDLVHTGRDYGEYTQLVNEYLTCIYNSDQAFLALTEYFSQIDRPVIICMVGDHGPNFAKYIIDDQYTPEEQELLLRKVPMLIWANYPLQQQELGTMSMNYVVPTLLDVAGIQLSPYYSQLIKMKEQVLILSAYGDYYDAEGRRYTYGSDAGMPYQKLVADYFCLEYHNIQSSKNRDWFDPYGS